MENCRASEHRRYCLAKLALEEFAETLLETCWEYLPTTIHRMTDMVRRLDEKNLQAVLHRFVLTRISFRARIFAADKKG